MQRLSDENDNVKRRLEQALDDMNKRDGDLSTLQRRLNDLEGDLEKERMKCDKLRRDNETICQVRSVIHFFSQLAPNFAIRKKNQTGNWIKTETMKKWKMNLT